MDICPICGTEVPEFNAGLLRCVKEAVRQRDEARRVARACWRAEPDEGVPLSIHEEVGMGGMAWLTEEGPEDIAARKAKEAADHAMMARVFNHPLFKEE